MHDPQTALVPLAHLYVHPFNARSEPPEADIEALADSIGAIGLLQNLAGFRDPDSRTDAPNIGIVAGGRRLRALMKLAQLEGRELTQTTVPVIITDDEDTARLWANAENTARQPLHPADEVRAYAAMRDKGAEPGTIARAFAKTTRHVMGRLALASLPQPALDALRENRINLDQAAGLTYAQNEESCLSVLELALSARHYLEPSQIKRRLQPAAIGKRDRRVIWLGLEVYRAAGGKITEDLFADDARIEDEALLDEMFRRKLQGCVEFCQMKGWKWVEALPDEPHGPNYAVTEKLERINRHPVELPDADFEELDALQERGEEEELTDAEIARMDELEDRARGDYAEEDVATSGLYLYVDSSGELQTSGPFRRKADRPAVAGADNDRAGAGSIPTTESRALSGSLIEDLRRIRLAALQIKMGGQPELMLDLLAYRLAGGLKPWAQVVSISPTAQVIEPVKLDGTEYPASLTGPDAIWLHGDQHADPAGFAAFRDLGKKHRNEVLARSIARTFQWGSDLAPSLAAQLRPDVRAIWTPTAAGFFNRLPVPVMESIWAELVPNENYSLQAFMDLKKGEKAKELEKLFGSADFREAIRLSRDQNARIDAWLPADLQWPSPAVAEQDDAA